MSSSPQYLLGSILFALLSYTGDAVWSSGYRPKLKVDATGKVAKNDGSMHVCIFSDRVDGLTGTLLSTALNAKNPEMVNIWVVTTNISAIDEVSRRVKHTKIKVHALDLDAVVNDLYANGHTPIWKWSVYNSSVLDNKGTFDRSWATEFTHIPGNWDQSTMHMHPLNHLRFYIPHMGVFKKLDRIIFMDDDIVVQGDMQQAWDAKKQLPKDHVIAGACEVWSFDSKFMAFKYVGRNSTFFTTSVLGQGGRDEKNTFCNAKRKDFCMGHRFYDNIKKHAMRINGKPYDMREAEEWNFGFTLLDLDNWKRLKMTDRYEEWMRVNYKDHIFPETSLTFGLGIAFLAFYDRVSCFDDITEPKIHIRDGYGYVSYPEFMYNGLDMSMISDGFVIHYDGTKKPWVQSGDPVLSLPFELTMKGMKSKDYKHLLEDKTFVQKVNKRNQEKVKNSFLVLSDIRAGSEWFMQVIDQHPEVCAGGATAMDGQRTMYPHDIFRPYNEAKTWFSRQEHTMHMQCYWNFIQRWVPTVRKFKHQWCNGKLTGDALDMEQHMPYLCKWANKDESKINNEQALFSEYVEQVLSADKDSFICSCPAGAKTVGARVMTDWIGGSHRTKNSQRYDDNELDDGTVAGFSMGPSVWKAIKKMKKKPKVIYFRRNIMSEIASNDIAAHHIKRLHGKPDVVEAMAVKEYVQRRQHRQYVEDSMKNLGIPILELDYEECDKDMHVCMRKAESFLGVSKFEGYNLGVTAENEFHHIEESQGSWQQLKALADAVETDLRELKTVTKYKIHEKVKQQLMKNHNLLASIPSAMFEVMLETEEDS